MFCAWTVSVSSSWLWYGTKRSQDVTFGGNWSETEDFSSICCHGMWLYCYLQIKTCIKNGKLWHFSALSLGLFACSGRISPSLPFGESKNHMVRSWVTPRKVKKIRDLTARVWMRPSMMNRQSQVRSAIVSIRNDSWLSFEAAKLCCESSAVIVKWQRHFTEDLKVERRQPGEQQGEESCGRFSRPLSEGHVTFWGRVMSEAGSGGRWGLTRWPRLDSVGPGYETGT